MLEEGGLGLSSISGKNYLGTKGKMCKAQSLSLATANCLLDSAGRGMGLAVWQCSHWQLAIGPPPQREAKI